MAGYSEIYIIGAPGGFMDSDGINEIFMQLLVGDGNRQWIEAVYFSKDMHPLGKVKTIVPKGPNHKNMLIDACLVFYPDLFIDCPSMVKVRNEIGDVEFMDFDFNTGIPESWGSLRNEAWPIFKTLNIYRAEITEYLHEE